MERWPVTEMLLFSWRTGIATRTTELWCSLLAHAIADDSRAVVTECLDWLYGTQAN